MAAISIAACSLFEKEDDVIARISEKGVDGVHFGDAGSHKARFDASALQSGVYVYRVSTPSGSASGQMHLVK